MTKPRNYKLEYEKFHDSPLARKRRAQRNKARRLMLRLGRVRKGQDVDHIRVNKGGNLNNSPRNLRAMSPSKNRGRNNN